MYNGGNVVVFVNQEPYKSTYSYWLTFGFVVLAVALVGAVALQSAVAAYVGVISAIVSALAVIYLAGVESFDVVGQSVLRYPRLAVRSVEYSLQYAPVRFRIPQITLI